MTTAVRIPAGVAQDPAGIEAAAAGLVVLAQAGHAATLTGRLVDLDTGETHMVALPWRAPLATVVDRVGAALAAFANGYPRHLAVLGEGNGSAGPGVQAEPRFEIRGGRAVCEAGDDSLLLAARHRVVRAACAARLATPAGGVRVYSDADERIVAGAHRPAPASPDTVLALIDDQIAHAAHATAIEDRDRTVSFGELGAMVAARADHFERVGVHSGDMVAVGLPRRAELIATLLALWSVGAAFLPVDARAPRSRLQSQLDAGRCRFVVLAEEPGQRFDNCQVLVAPGRTPGGEPAARWSRPRGLAYAMSTSGSTGRPKVVGITHAALARCVTTFAGLLGVDRPAVAATTALTFDISLLEIFLPLATGGRLLLADDELRHDPARLGAWLIRHRPDIVQATPTAWRLILPHLTGAQPLHGRTVLCGGEALTADLARALLGTGAGVWNLYGPTEATIWCVAAQLRSPVLDPVPIGRPVPGTLAAVVDRSGRTVPVGQIGELVLGGGQLAVGYLGDPDRTNASFVDTELGRGYRTGDLCAWRTDGTLAFHGRVDNQVKIRGQRIELEEIEAHAERHPGVARAAAVLITSNENSTAENSTDDDQRLVLYIQPASAGDDPAADVRVRLGEWLTAALMPQWIRTLPALPLTASQKVDRPALREAARADLRRHRVREETS